MGRLGPMELGIILVLVLLIFGPKNLPRLGRGVGQFFRNFKGGLKEVQKESQEINDQFKT